MAVVDLWLKASSTRHNSGSRFNLITPLVSFCILYHFKVRAFKSDDY